ncbi:type II secretion system protein G [compost metagenome]|uniref:Type IV pilus assembly protein PilE n=1 Tax=Pseudomonas jinjuensis TaxID=198616 RepID=A0A1H0G1S9_9PSED|nr:type IV pilin protein [Pseudomonas jinjuensis]SDO00843.1 type IV pilus assembly protein PilE [Pseudomonas jinjuensis]
MPGKHRGFTLIELMIVVAIVAILASIALPAYHSHIDRSRIRAAQADLVALSLNLENAYQRTLAYPAATLASTTAVKDRFPAWHPAESSFGYSVNASAAAYTVTATGNGGRLAGCTISLTHDHVRSIASCGSYNGSWQ